MNGRQTLAISPVPNFLMINCPRAKTHTLTAHKQRGERGRRTLPDQRFPPCVLDYGLFAAFGANPAKGAHPWTLSPWGLQPPMVETVPAKSIDEELFTLLLARDLFFALIKNKIVI